MKDNFVLLLHTNISMYSTILETLGPKEVIYAIPWPPASPLALLKPPKGAPETT